jgi:hypothetical protein
VKVVQVAKVTQVAPVKDDLQEKESRDGTFKISSTQRAKEALELDKRSLRPIYKTEKPRLRKGCVKVIQVVRK